ncbi:MAG TPA: HAMP domain-containing sensor histidine kinase [Kofleriaceae bacterium]|nr:HAMP domain-containing sensor histidine kinase [Kofleriaceae bacterium]
MSIRFRFTLALITVGVVLFGTYSVWSYRSERDDLQTAATKEIRIVGRSLETSVGHALRDQRGHDVDQLLAALETLAPNVDIHIHDPAGQPIAHSKGAELDTVVEGLAARAATARTELVSFEPTDEPTRLIFAAPLVADDGTLLGSIAIARPTDDMTEDLARTRNRHIIALVAFLIATLTTGLALGTLHVARPIGRLLEGVRHVREGDFRMRVRPGRHDEIGRLVDEFNSMIDVLEDSRAKIEREAEARSKLEEGLQRVDKLVTIGQLSAGLAHEIGSPLQVLSGRASALLDHADAEVKRQAALLVTQCDRITRVVEQLLSFGRRKAAVVGPCDLAVPVREVIDLLAGEARRRNVSLALDVGEGSRSITGDPDQLQQVTLNLVRNALHATPSGGTIHVRIERGNRRVRLRVKDSGPGIGVEAQAHLFEPFFTTRSSEGGTGLGLAVVKAIALEHKATIDVHSTPGNGAEFVVAFPEASHD